MKRDTLLSLSDKWISETGPNSDVVISSRIRLARNLKNLPFPHMMDDNDIKKLLNLINDTVDVFNGKVELWKLEDLTNIEKLVLVEKHLISPEHAEKGKGAVLLNDDKSISIMVLEEDHLRTQVILPGFDLFEGFKIADEIDDLLESKLDIAFNEKYGYLTSCPTNVGTGLRASVMLHLPGLVLTKQANRILTALSQVGVVVRGIYGEGTEALGNLFQISNQITLGRTEKDIINNLYTVVLRLIDQEKEAREILLRETKPVLSDKVHRAYGILTNARVITSEETLSLLSDMKLGMELNLLDGIDKELYTKLMTVMQPAYLQYSMNKEMSSMDRDICRAEKVRKMILNN